MTAFPASSPHGETDAGPCPAILHLHPGGFVLGEPEMSDAANRIQASAFGAIIVSVDYRKPPEHPFPARLDDCYEALRWLQANATELNVDPSRTAVKRGHQTLDSIHYLPQDRGGSEVLSTARTAFFDRPVFRD